MQLGCLLPFLIIFNLFFGWMFLRPPYWALLELGLILAFILTSAIIVRRVTRFTGRQDSGSGRIRSRGRHGEVIDVEGEQIKPEDKKNIE